MSLVDIIPILGSVATIGLGLVGLFRPAVLAEASGVQAVNELGMGELRSLFGAVILVLGSSALIFREPVVYLVAGAAFVAAAAVKMVSIVVDHPPVSQAVPGIVFDLAIGLALTSGYVFVP